MFELGGLHQLNTTEIMSKIMFKIMSKIMIHTKNSWKGNLLMVENSLHGVVKLIHLSKKKA